VPFVMRAGKAVNETKDEIRLQLKPSPHMVLGVEMGEEIILQMKPENMLSFRVPSCNSEETQGTTNALTSVSLVKFSFIKDEGILFRG